MLATSRVVLGVWAFFAVSLTFGQMTTDRLEANARSAKDLVFPAQESDITSAKTPVMAIYKPPGAGPFPSVLLVPPCSGLRTSKPRWENLSILAWARYAVDRGYVALVIDNFEQRNAESVCAGPSNGLNLFRGVLDAHQAADYLRKLPYADKSRVFLAGFSWGGMISLLASSDLWSKTYGGGNHFVAAAALYPRCKPATPPGEAPFEIINKDIQNPVLVLVGQKDVDQPASECESRVLPLTSGGVPISIQSLPDATHCWDCENLDGLNFRDKNGDLHTVTYNKRMADLAKEETFNFFDKNQAR